MQKRSSGSLGDGVQITIRLASPGWEVGESQLRGMGAQRREAHGVEQEGGCGHLGPRLPYDLKWEENSTDHDQSKEEEPQACECQSLPRD